MLQPFFILGNPRSGTTLLRLILDANPHVVVPPECGFALWFFNKYENWTIDNCSVNSINLFIEDLKTAKKIDSWELDYMALASYILNMKPNNYASLIDSVYRYYASKHKPDINIWGDKNNFHINHICEIFKLFPNAKFIHIIRDGRDVACSYKELCKKKIKSAHAPKLSDNISCIAEEWSNNNIKILKDLSEFIKPDSYISVKYEDIVINSLNESNKLCKFLKIPFSNKMLEYYKHSTTYEPEEFLQWKANTKKPLQKGSINRYKKELSKKEITLFNKVAKKTLDDFNYEI